MIFENNINEMGHDYYFKKIEQDMKTDEALNNTINIIRKKINPI